MSMERMKVLAELTQFTEPAFVIGAFNPATLWMSVQTLVSGRAVPILGIPPTFGHSTEVILVQELTCITFLAQSAEPVLANGCEAFALARVCRELLGRLEILQRWVRVS